MVLQGPLSLFFLASLYFVVVQPKGITDCYYRSWAYFKRNEIAKFVPEDIDPNLCSVVTYANYVVDDITYEMKGRQKRDLDHDLLQRINKLKEKRPGLKVVISVGGWNHESKPRFSKMTETAERRKIFIDSVIAILNRSKVDGISIDWEYPNVRPEKLARAGELENDKQNLVKLLHEIRVAFEADKICNDKKERYLLAMALPSNREKFKGFDIVAVEKYADWVNVMAYNMRGQWSSTTGCPTLMYGDVLPTVPDSINAWIEAGLSPAKINLGLAFYGRGFVLSNPSNFNVGAASIKGLRTEATPILQETGVLAYYEICKTNFSHYANYIESGCGIPYAVNTTTGYWVAYEDPGSVKYKIRTLVNKLGLNGFSVWSLDFDDFNGGYCTENRYPILTAGVREMMGGATEELIDPVQQYHTVSDGSVDLGKPMEFQ